MRIASALIAALVLATPVYAGSASPRSGSSSVETTRGYDPARKQLREPDAAPPLPATAAEPANSGPTDGPLFRLNSIVIEGANAVPRNQLEAAFADFIGRDVQPSDLSAIAERISVIYRDSGFSLSRAIIPRQDIVGGRVRVSVLEGYVADIVVKGGETGDFGAQRLLAALADERPLRQSSLERYLLLVNDTPGMRIADTSVDEIEKMSGRFRLTVRIETWDAFVAAGADNRGTAAVGRYQGYVNPSLNSILTPGDTFDIALSTIPDQPNELRFARMTYSAPLDAEGTRIAGGISYGQIRPGDIRHEFGDITETQRFDLKATIVPFRTREASLTLGAGADIDNIRERIYDGMISDDNVRAVTLTSDAELHDDLQGSNYLSLSVRQGLGIFGASKRGDDFLSRYDGSGSFTTADLFLTRYQKIDDNWSLKIAGAGQIASRALLASEEFYLGGAAFGRAYDAGAISGDNALAASAELRYDHSATIAALKSYELYAFADYGGAWTMTDSGNFYRAVASTGGGLRLNFQNDFQGSVEFATPLEQDATRNFSVYFSIAKALRLCPYRASMECHDS